MGYPECQPSLIHLPSEYPIYSAMPLTAIRRCAAHGRALPAASHKDCDKHPRESPELGAVRSTV